VDIAACGSATIRCRPGLYFTPKHAAVFLEKFDAALRAKGDALLSAAAA